MLLPVHGDFEKGEAQEQDSKSKWQGPSKQIWLAYERARANGITNRV